LRAGGIDFGNGFPQPVALARMAMDHKAIFTDADAA
jgi:hypothetical protein